MGARVFAAASSEDKLALCRKLGADEIINYVSGNLRDRVKELTGGKGVDVVFDPVGGPYTESALRATAWGGRLLVIGFAAGDIPKIPINLALLKERSIVGVYWGESVKHDPEGHLRNVKQLMEWFAAGKVKPSVSERVPLSEAAARDEAADPPPGDGQGRHFAGSLIGSAFRPVQRIPLQGISDGMRLS